MGAGARTLGSCSISGPGICFLEATSLLLLSQLWKTAISTVSTSESIQPSRHILLKCLSSQCPPPATFWKTIVLYSIWWCPSTCCDINRWLLWDDCHPVSSERSVIPVNRCDKDLGRLRTLLGITSSKRWASLNSNAGGPDVKVQCLSLTIPVTIQNSIWHMVCAWCLLNDWVSHHILGGLTFSELFHPMLELREGHTCSAAMSAKLQAAWRVLQGTCSGNFPSTPDQGLPLAVSEGI